MTTSPFVFRSTNIFNIEDLCLNNYITSETEEDTYKYTEFVKNIVFETLSNRCDSLVMYIILNCYNLGTVKSLYDILAISKKIHFLYEFINYKHLFRIIFKIWTGKDLN